MGDFHSSGAGPASELASEWHAAMQGVQERLSAEIDDYLSWQQEATALLQGVRDALEDGLASLPSSEGEDYSSLLGAMDMCDQALSACNNLSEGRVADAKMLIARAEDVDSYLASKLTGEDDSGVIAQLETSEEWQALTDIPDRDSEVFRFDQITDDLVAALTPIAQSEKEIGLGQQQIWAVGTLNVGSEDMFSAILWTRIHDGEIRQLLPGIAGDAARQQA